MNSHFFEKQRFTQWWIWLLFLFTIATFGAAIVMQVIYHKDFGNNPMSDFGLYIGLALSIIALIFFRSLKLETIIDTHSVKVRFYPFRRKFLKIPSSLIQSAQVRTFNPLSEFGGWGVRGIKSDRALTVSGKHGLQLVFTDGRKLLIGTRKPEELQKQIEKLLKQA